MNTPDRHEAGLNLERTVFFSDAVIAIAMTLLALELHLPSSWSDFGHHLTTDYMAFMISFAVIATFWFQHHRFFQHIERLNTPLTLLNLFSLFAVVLVPFAAKVLPEGGHTSLPPVLYASVMCLWGIAYVLMVLAANRGNLWHKWVSPSTPGSMIFGACAALGTFALSIPIAFLDAGLAQLSWLLIPFVATLLGRLRGRFMIKSS